MSMGQLVNDAKELVMRLKEREKSVDQVVIQSNALAKKVDALQQVSLSYYILKLNSYFVVFKQSNSSSIMN